MTLTQAARQMEEAGISLSVSAPDGGRARLPAKDIQRYLRGPDAYWAERTGVSVTMLAQWREAMACGVVRCAATTKQSLPCKGLHFLDEPLTPAQFQAKSPFYCPTHQGRSQ